MKLVFCDGADIGRREEQQDDKTNLRLADGHLLCVMADGMGGAAGGRRASQIVCQVFRRYFAQARDLADPWTELYRAMLAANAEIEADTRRNPELQGMGSTLLALLIREETGLFSFLSVGDSPLYLHQGGRLFRLNANHAHAEELRRQVARGLLSQEEAACHPRRSSVSSALMGEEVPFIDQKEGQLVPGSLLILASDGLQTLDDGPTGRLAEVVEGAGGDPEKVAEGLLQAVRAADAPDQDNTTIMVVGLTEAVPGRMTAEFRTAPPETVRRRRLIRVRWGLAAGLACLAAAGWLWFRSGAEPEPEPTMAAPAQSSPAQPEPTPLEAAATPADPPGIVKPTEAPPAENDEGKIQP